MSTMIRSVAMASSFALMAFGAVGVATAQDTKNSKKMSDECIEQNCADEMPGNSRKQRSQNNQNYNQDADQPGTMQVRKNRSAQNSRNWRFDSNRHERRRNKDRNFRFYFGGFYYPQPYWTGESYGIQAYRVSCGEGRNIVDDSGYNRVRTIECRGATFTYVGRRNGDTFRVFLNSRTGRIVGRREV